MSESLRALMLNLTNLISDDYNSWQESWRGRRLRKGMDKDTILAEGKLIPAALNPSAPPYM